MPDATLFAESPPAAVNRTAVISPCSRYRYLLTRTWDPARAPVAWLMLNPSTADAARDDATIRRCIGYARRWGHGGIDVYNLFNLRATDPAELAGSADPVGPEGDEYLRRLAASGRRLILAWGCHGAFRGRDAEVLRILTREWQLPYTPPECLRVTRDGNPCHPVRLPADLVPRVFPAWRSVE
jgi:hypothetical protein